MAVDGAHPSPYPGPEPGPPLAAYDAESLARCWRGASAYCLTAAILLLTFAALDRTRFPDAAATLLLVRALGAAALGFLLVLLQTRFGVRHARARQGSSHTTAQRTPAHGNLPANLMQSPSDKALLGDRQEVNYPVGQARRPSRRVCLNLPLAL